MIVTEAWLPIPGWEGSYEVSDQGRVKSLPRKGSDGRRLPGVVLKQRADTRGYPVVQLCRKRPKTCSVHRLVAMAFLADSHFDGAEVCHNDGTQLNNHVENLRWGTRSENISDCVRHGTHPNASKTHCKRGHEFTPENTFNKTRGNGRECRACVKALGPARHARQRELRKCREMPERAHGTVGGYDNWWCRCELCREAQRVAGRKRRAAASAPTGTGAIGGPFRV